MHFIFFVYFFVLIHIFFFFLPSIYIVVNIFCWKFVQRKTYYRRIACQRNWVCVCFCRSIIFAINWSEVLWRAMRIFPFFFLEWFVAWVFLFDRERERNTKSARNKKKSYETWHNIVCCRFCRCVFLHSQYWWKYKLVKFYQISLLFFCADYWSLIKLDK